MSYSVLGHVTRHFFAAGCQNFCSSPTTSAHDLQVYSPTSQYGLALFTSKHVLQTFPSVSSRQLLIHSAVSLFQNGALAFTSAQVEQTLLPETTGVSVGHASCVALFQNGRVPPDWYAHVRHTGLPVVSILSLIGASAGHCPKHIYQ